MRIVVDVNILLSALIANSTTRKIIFHGGHELYFPEISMEKIKKYKGMVLEKGNLPEEDFDSLLELLMSKIELVKTEYFGRKIRDDEKIMSKIDEEDATFVALALSIPECSIWSNDKHLRMQNRVNVVRTRDLL